MNDYLAITQALGDPTRVRALMLLADGELCVCQIVDVIGLAPATVSRHLSILQRAGLIERRKQGRWAYYRLAGRNAPAIVRQALRWTMSHLEAEKVVVRDATRRCDTRSKDPKELACCHAAN